MKHTPHAATATASVPPEPAFRRQCLHASCMPTSSGSMYDEKRPHHHIFQSGCEAYAARSYRHREWQTPRGQKPSQRACMQAADRMPWGQCATGTDRASVLSAAPFAATSVHQLSPSPWGRAPNCNPTATACLHETWYALLQVERKLRGQRVTGRDRAPS